MDSSNDTGFEYIKSANASADTSSSSAANTAADDQADSVEEKDDSEKDIFDLLGASSISDEEKGALLGQMLDLIDTRVLDRILSELNEEDRSELEKIVQDENNDEKFQQFIDEKVPNYEEMYVEEAKKLKQELVIDLSK